MFFQLDLLRRGGKFHFCWLADSWPERFSTITHRQLSSVNITELCEELQEFIQRESRSSYNRFSLRLSCQLVHGITRLYRRKANACLSDICVLNAKILRQKRLKDTPKEPLGRQQGTRGNTDTRIVPFSHPSNEECVEERIENSGNAVARVEDITLKEVEIPPHVVINDGFGEENEQAINSLIQGLAESMEVMMLGSEHSLLGQISGADLSGLHDSRDFRIERVANGTRARMEGIVEDSFLMLNLDPESYQQMPGYAQKDLPEIPEIHLEIQETHPVISEIQEPVQELAVPTVVVHPTETRALENDKTVASPPRAPAHSTPAPAPRTRRKRAQAQLAEPMEEEIQLEAVDTIIPTRRRPKKLKIDKAIMIDSAHMRDRMAQTHIETRCEVPGEDIAEFNLPTEVFFKRPSCAGMKNSVFINRQFVTNFQRCCMVGTSNPREEREIELERGVPDVSSINVTTEPTNITFKTPDHRPAASPAHSRLTMEGKELPLIVEEEEREATTESGKGRSFLDLVNLTAAAVMQGTEDQNIAMDLPTQNITEEIQSRKRTADQVGDIESPSKVPHVSRTSMRLRMSYGQPAELIDNTSVAPSVPNVAQQELPQISMPIEEIPMVEVCEGEQIPVQSEQTKSFPEPSTVKNLLHSAGLADRPSNGEKLVNVRQSRRSRDSETPLGSLDRTAVSLGDSDTSTESQRYIKEEWGTEATMSRIMQALRHGKHPLTIQKLLVMETIRPGMRRSLVAASCFSSILKLKQCGFLKIIKNDLTLEIIDIDVGPRTAPHLQ